MGELSTHILFDAIRAVLKSESVGADDKRLTNNEYFEEALSIAKNHDIAHLMIQGISQKVPDDFLSKKLKQIPFLAVLRYEKSNYELNRMCEVLERNKIAYMPLKGSVLQKHYPEPWMRTSCDIDILVRENDLSRATKCLADELEYEIRHQYTHDVSIFSKSNVHIELHFDLIENSVSESSAEILENVWDSACLKEGTEYHFEMPDEMLYFYHIAHMAKHFENGGCGIRPFIDLWILDNIDGVDHAKRDELLFKGKLLKFANTTRKLSKVWFEGAQMDTVSRQMQNYILRGGVYGTDENRIVIHQQKKGGKLKYAISKVFIPYDVIKFHYPILEKHKWLTPIMEVRRWGKLIFCGHLKRTANELIYNKNISNKEAQNVKAFLDSIGL